MKTETFPRPVHVAFIANKVAAGQTSLRVLPFSPAIIIPLMLHSLRPPTQRNLRNCAHF